MGYQAITVKDTTLRTVDNPSVPVKKGTPVTVIYEEAGLGTVRVTIDGESLKGLMPKSDYQATSDAATAAAAPRAKGARPAASKRPPFPPTARATKANKTKRANKAKRAK
jgi:hypothetical protein